jgi:segregation and condensation protein B
MKEIKNKVEAVLYTTGRFMEVEEIARLCGIGSIGLVRDALKELYEDYHKRDSALELVKENGKFKLNIKKKYVYLTTNLLNDCELDVPTQETLAIIAYKQPILQSDLIKARGNSAYEHIKTLREEAFITSERYGHTRLLKLAPKFYDYFDVVDEQIQSKFKEVEQKVGTEEEIQKKLKDNKVEDNTAKEEDKTEESEEKKKKKKNVEEELLELIEDNEDVDLGDSNIPEGSISFD